MSLPKGFLFNSSNLQDYVECQRRFQLRFLDRLVWPAVEVEPYLDYEHMIQNDMQFHKIIRQHLNGISETQISTVLGDIDLSAWWKNFLLATQDGVLSPMREQSNQIYEGLSLSVPIDEYRLQAKYDLVVHQPDGRFFIYNWITSKTRPDRKWFADRIKTHVYPLVLLGGMSNIAKGERIDPSMVEMIYWFANQPEKPEQFTYDQNAYQADEQYLQNLISTIKGQSDPIFPLTPDVRRCLFCTYRSFCDRGTKPGELEQLHAWQVSDPASEDLAIDFEQIGEIDY